MEGRIYISDIYKYIDPNNSKINHDLYYFIKKEYDINHFMKNNIESKQYNDENKNNNMSNYSYNNDNYDKFYHYNHEKSKKYKNLSNNIQPIPIPHNIQPIIQPPSILISPNIEPQFDEPIIQSELKEESNCKVCLDNKSTYAFIPCGHLCICENCINDINQCILCQTKSINKLKIFI